MSRREQDRKNARAEVASSAGVNYGRASLEVLYLLPENFLDAYVKLFHKALKEDSSSPLGNQQQYAELGRATGKGKGRVAKHQKGAPVGSFFTVKDEKAFAEKKRVDKRLRAIAREIGMTKEERDKQDLKHRVRCNSSLEAEISSRRIERVSRTPGCGRWIEQEWFYCPWCGGRND